MIIKSHGFPFLIQYLGYLCTQEGDRSRAVDAIERRFERLSAQSVAAIWGASVRQIEHDDLTPDARALLKRLDNIATAGAAAATRGWNNPDDSFVMLSAWNGEA